MGAVSISGLEGVKFVQLDVTSVGSNEKKKSTEDTLSATVDGSATDGSSTDGSTTKQQLIDQLFSGFSGQQSDTTSAPSTATEELVLGEGMEIFIEMDESEEGEGLFTMDSFFDMSAPTVTATTAADTETVDIASPPLSPSDILLRAHNGAAYRMMDGRRQQMISQVQSTEDRIVALKSKISEM